MGHTFKSTPIINFMRQAQPASKRYMDWHRGAYSDLTPVEEAKRRLGRQSYTWTGTNRHWIWEGQDPRSEKRWRLYASTRGYTVEVESDVDVADLDGLFAHFLEVWNEA
jgi:hypothetical protein